MLGSVLILAYLIGSIPTGYWLGRVWKGIDIRKQGSGNLGATNVFRVLGKMPGLMTLIFDILKGVLPVLAARHFGFDPRTVLLVGLCTIIGHMTSVFVRFRGGKGVATGAGVFMALLPLPSLAALLLFGLSLAVTRIVSISSMVGAVGLAVAGYIHAPHAPEAHAAIALAVIILWKHRTNLQRLMNGTEPRIGAGKIS